MLVSILIPCYNAELWVAQAIESALGQTWADKEVIVLDDGSTDSSLEIIRRYAGEVRWETGPNRGGNAARNRLLKLSKGHWVQYLDADDYLLPQKLEWQIASAASNSSARVVYSPALFEECNDDNSPKPLRSFPLEGADDPWIRLARWKLPQTGGALFQRSALEEVDGWNEEFRCCQEHELYLRLLMRSIEFHHCPASGAVYRYWRGPSVSRSDPQLVNMTRLKLLQGIQEFLFTAQLATSERIAAINQTRFEIARSMWGTHREISLDVMSRIQRLEPHFMPCGPASGTLYRGLFRILGFGRTEAAAGLTRSLRTMLRIT